MNKNSKVKTLLVVIMRLVLAVGFFTAGMSVDTFLDNTSHPPLVQENLPGDCASHIRLVEIVTDANGIPDLIVTSPCTYLEISEKNP